MAFCKNCGTQLSDTTTFCPNCGTTQDAPITPPVVDNGGFGWGLLGCCIPLVGLILFLVWKDTKPKSAKSAGIGALVSVGVGLLFYILMVVAGVAFSFM